MGKNTEGLDHALKPGYGEKKRRGSRSRQTEDTSHEAYKYRTWLTFALDTMDAGIWQWDIATDTRIWSDSVWDLLGLSPARPEPSYDAWFQTIHPEDRNAVEATTRASIASHQAYEIEWRIILRDGSVRWLMSRAMPFFEAGGELSAYLGLLFDITKENRMAGRLRDKDRLIDHVINSSPDLIIAKDKDLRTLFCNRAFASSLGRTPVELTGNTDAKNGFSPGYILGNPSRGIRGNEADELEVLAGETVRKIVDLAEYSDDERVFDIIKVPMKDETGQIIGLMSTSRDISLQVEMQKALAKRERELSAATADLRTLADHLYNIREEERRRIASDIHDDLGQRLTALNLGLHWASTLAAENPDLLPAHLAKLVELNTGTIDSVQDLASRLRPRILDDIGLEGAIEWLVSDIDKRGGPQCTLSFELGGTTLDTAVTTTLFRVSQECVSNVLRHAEAKHVVIALRREGDWLAFSVEDDGVGIGTALRSGDLSLGLIGMRERALQLGGSFSIGDREGGGTKVLFRIPIHGETEDTP